MSEKVGTVKDDETEAQLNESAGPVDETTSRKAARGPEKVAATEYLVQPIADPAALRTSSTNATKVLAATSGVKSAISLQLSRKQKFTEKPDESTRKDEHKQEIENNDIAPPPPPSKASFLGESPSALEDLKDIKSIVDSVDTFCLSEKEKSISIDETDSLEVSDSESSQQISLAESKSLRSIFNMDLFDDLPDLDDISIDKSIYSGEILSAEPSQLSLVDKGKFVDPITGEVLDSSETSEEVVEEVQGEEGEEEDYEDEMLLQFEVEEVADLAYLDVDEEGADMFLELFEPPKKVTVLEEIDFAAIERERERRILDAFMNEMISSAVEKAEFVDTTEILRKSLDKSRLMKQLKILITELLTEQKANHFLNYKCVEHFRRKKAFRAIQENKVETILSDIEKYKQTINRYDEMLAKSDETKRTVSLQIENLEALLRDESTTARNEIEALENLIRKTLIRGIATERMKQSVEKRLLEMAKFRDEISKVRYTLIQRQSTTATLLEKLEALENLGSGLRLCEYETLQTQTQRLDKKVEERNIDLEKYRLRHNSNMHMLAHLREKQKMMRNALEVQKAILEELLKEKNHCREHLLKFRIERTKLRKEIKEMSFQGGLLDKPALMLDYDATVEKLEKLRISVARQRAVYSEMTQKLRRIEQRAH